MMRHKQVFRFLTGPVLLMMVLLGMPAIGWAQSANDGFDPNANNSVFALAVQPDGKTLVGGSFTTIAGQTRNRLARLNVDGSLDAGFAVTDVDNDVMAIAVQADGRIVIGGLFAQVGVYIRNHIARLNADGSVDTAFDPNANSTVSALALQADGQLLLAGNFNSLSPNGGGPITRNHIARLNANGTLDAAFNPNVNGGVRDLALQRDGKLVLSGNFTTLSPNDASAVMRNYIARLNTDGSLDTTFNPNANNAVSRLALQHDGKIVLCGQFTSLSPNGGAAIARKYMARVNADGSVDMTFNPNADSLVYALVLQPDGKLVLGGFFGSLSPNGGAAIPRNFIARLNVDGTVDMAFNPNASYSVHALALQPDGKLLLGGQFTSLSPNGGTAITRNRIARLNADGSADAVFIENPNGAIYTIAQQPDGKLVVNGDFTSLSPNGGGPVTRSKVARLNVDGSLDPAFNPNANSTVAASVVQPDGKVVFGGQFISLSPNGGGAITRNHVARMNADGSLDTAFNPNVNSGDVNSIVNTFALQPDGKLILGGRFTTLAPAGGGTITRNRIARLNVDGSLDTAFDPNVDGEVYIVALQPDGKLLLGGFFHSLSPNGGGAITRNYIARLNVDGSLDAAFDPNPNNAVGVLALQPDGAILVGGEFTSFSPHGGPAVSRGRIARLDADGSLDSMFNPNANSRVYALTLQTDGAVVAGGEFTSLTPGGGGTIARGRIARLNADGGVDPSFNPNANSAVYNFALQPDGKLIVGGVFSMIGGLARSKIARFSTPLAALQSISIVNYTAGGSTITWSRAGPGPELALPPQLLFSLAGSTFSTVGIMQRTSGGWRYSGFAAPLNQNFYLRTRGKVTSGIGNGSSGLIESTLQVYLSDNDGIFANGFE